MSGDSNSPWIKHTMPRHSITTTLCGAALAAVPVGVVQAQSPLRLEAVLVDCLLVGLINEFNFDFGDALATTGNYFPITAPPDGNLAGGVIGLGYSITFEEPVVVDPFTGTTQWFADALWAYDDPSNASACFLDYLLSFATHSDLNNPWGWGYWNQCSPPLADGALQVFVAESVMISTPESNLYRLEVELSVSEEFGDAMYAAGWTNTNIGGSLAGTYRLDITTVPAPGAVAILGLAGLAGSRRRRD